MAKTTKKTPKKTAAKAAQATTAMATKTVVKKATAKKTAGKKKVAKKALDSRPTPARRISAHERHTMIAEAAYLRGEAQDFLNDEREDWLLAEAEIDTVLTKARVEVTG